LSLRLLRRSRGRRPEIRLGTRLPLTRSGAPEHQHERTDHAREPDGDEAHARPSGYSPAHQRCQESSGDRAAAFSFTFQVIAITTGTTPTGFGPCPLGRNHTLPVDFDHRVTRMEPLSSPRRLPTRPERAGTGAVGG
jgi:hypothetical protein